MITKEELKEMDRQVGARLKARRKTLGMSLTQVANKLGISYQQIQKYELGNNRVGASRLLSFSKLYEVPITQFFTGLEEASKGEKVELDGKIIETARAITLIKDDRSRKAIKALIRSLVDK
jgi:transcriptional regulator with XRE-family HTH domain